MALGARLAGGGAREREGALRADLAAALVALVALAGGEAGSALGALVAAGVGVGPGGAGRAHAGVRGALGRVEGAAGAVLAEVLAVAGLVLAGGALVAGVGAIGRGLARRARRALRDGLAAAVLVEAAGTLSGGTLGAPGRACRAAAPSTRWSRRPFSGSRAPLPTFPSVTCAS